MTVKPRHLTEEQTEAPSGKGTALSAQGRRAAVLLRRGSIPRGPEVPTALLGKARLGSLRPVLCCRGPRHPALLSGGGRRDTRGWAGANALLRDLPLPPWGRWGGQLSVRRGQWAPCCWLSPLSAVRQTRALPVLGAPTASGGKKPLASDATELEA